MNIISLICVSLIEIVKCHSTPRLISSTSTVSTEQFLHCTPLHSLHEVEQPTSCFLQLHFLVGQSSLHWYLITFISNSGACEKSIVLDWNLLPRDDQPQLSGLTPSHLHPEWMISSMFSCIHCWWKILNITKFDIYVSQCLPPYKTDQSVALSKMCVLD